jgi:para-aminobenzoate synthetase component 1
MMSRVKKSFLVEDVQKFASSALRWAHKEFDINCLLNSNDYKLDKYSSLKMVLAAGTASKFTGTGKDDFDKLKTFSDQSNDWIFGFMGYDLKNQLENLESNNHDGIKMPDMHFFVPKVLFFLEETKVEISCIPNSGLFSNPDEIFDLISKITSDYSEKAKPVNMKPKVSQKKYIENVKEIRNHIQVGNIYEMNYCIEFYANDVLIDPVSVYKKLTDLSPTPFSCFYKLGDKYLMCASPERFLRKTGTKLISQPIKGTARRGADPKEDELLKKHLQQDPKERSENVMIVDLVRNDMSRTAQKGTVKVEELYGIYSFRQVHQMISTVVSELRSDVHFVDTIKSCFPMGSMTGAPKIMAMKLIEQYEDTKRGLFSGTVGYISPEKDFDFNVVIRSLTYNQQNKYLSYMAGGAITNGSVPEKELEEVMLKAKAMERALGN